MAPHRNCVGGRGEHRRAGAAILQGDFLACEREYQDSYRQIPAFDDLAARYGDITNRRVYMMSRNVEGQWFNMHHRETGAAHPID